MNSKYQAMMNRRVWKDASFLFRDRVLLLDKYQKGLTQAITIQMKDYRTKLVKSVAKLDSLSPLKTLSRGYSVIQNNDDKVILSVRDLHQDDTVQIILQDGKVGAKIL